MTRVIPVLAVLLLAPATASAEHFVYYHDYHPIPEAFGGGYCDVEDVHPHEYVPVELDYFQVQDGVYYYIGDPGDDGFEELYWYEDHHPVPTHWGGGICYLWGPHRHWWRPHVHVHYQLLNGRWIYRGRWGKRYRASRRIKPLHVGRRHIHKGVHRKVQRQRPRAIPRRSKADRKPRKAPRSPSDNARRPPRQPRPHYRTPAKRYTPASTPPNYRNAKRKVWRPRYKPRTRPKRRTIRLRTPRRSR